MTKQFFSMLDRRAALALIHSSLLLAPAPPGRAREPSAAPALLCSFCATETGSYRSWLLSSRARGPDLLPQTNKTSVCSNKQLLFAKAKNQMPKAVGSAPKQKLPPSARLSSAK